MLASFEFVSSGTRKQVAHTTDQNTHTKRSAHNACHTRYVIRGASVGVGVSAAQRGTHTGVRTTPGQRLALGVCLEASLTAVKVSTRISNDEATTGLSFGF